VPGSLLQQGSGGLILIAGDLQRGGHGPGYLKAWTGFLQAEGISHEVRHLQSASVGFTPLGRFTKVLVDAGRTIFFWGRLWRRLKSRDICLFLDAPCSFPLGIRMMTAAFLRCGVESRAYSICHAFPGGGDCLPFGGSGAPWRKYFPVAKVFVHSRELGNFLRDEVGLRAGQIHSYSWGCPPVRESQPPTADGFLKLLFLGQYRNSKGLEWLWEQLQELPIPCRLQAIVSCDPEVGSRVSERLASVGARPIHQLALAHKHYFSEEEMDAGFQLSDVMVLPYLREHRLVSGIVYLAAHHGCPVISSTHSESGRIASDHGFGFCFEPADGRGLRDCLEKFWTLPPEKKTEMRRRAAQFARDHQWKIVLRDVLHHMEGLRVL